jgi:mRNA interferase MazF
MPVTYHPRQGCIVHVSFDEAFKEPEMVKSRLCVVVSKPIQARPNLCTVIPLSTTAPNKIMPYHYQLTIPFPLPDRWSAKTCWAKCDMIYSAGFHRVDLLRLGKESGRRIYQTECIPDESFRNLQRAMLHGLGLSYLTKHL